jgi:hypothetical protein
MSILDRRNLLEYYLSNMSILDRRRNLLEYYLSNMSISDRRNLLEYYMYLSNTSILDRRNLLEYYLSNTSILDLEKFCWNTTYQTCQY